MPVSAIQPLRAISASIPKASWQLEVPGPKAALPKIEKHPRRLTMKMIGPGLARVNWHPPKVHGPSRGVPPAIGKRAPIR